MEKNQTENHAGDRPRAISSRNFISAAAQLKADIAKIKALWEQRVRAESPMAEGQTSLALQNSLEIFLDELVAALEESSLASASDPNKQGMSGLHGGQRAKFAGYFLPQLLVEFSILREVIMQDLYKADVLDFKSGLIVNSAIDSSISLAATEFAKVQQENQKAALDKAEASNRDLEHFAAVAAHDLKSPLATISGYLGLLPDDPTEPIGPESIEYVGRMQKTSERMQNLIERLLDYARLAKRDRVFQSVDLNNVMKAVLQNLNEAIRKNHATVNVGRMPVVNGDPELLIQVFQNLIANSIKFRGNPAPVIHVESKVLDRAFQFSVTDNGIGFDPKDKEKIFDLYKQLRGEAKYRGTGIGLATCKKVVELLGGRIWAESTPGSGSTFYLTLPKPDSVAVPVQH